MNYYIHLINQLNATNFLSKSKFKINPYYTLFFIFQCISYKTFGWLTMNYNLQLWSPHIIWDEHLPLISLFVPIYLIYYLVLFWPLMLSLTKRQDFQLSLSMLIISCINYLISFTVSNEYSPQAIIHQNDILTSILSWIYEVDYKSLYFPSLHAAHSLLIGFYLWKWKGYKIFLVLAVLISLSTVFVKQHFVLDTIGALCFVLAIYYFMPYILKLLKRS